MKNRPNQQPRQARQVPLDHLRPGARPRDEPETAAEAPAETSRQGAAESSEPGALGSAQPSEPATPGGGDADAARGKATGSPAAVATRRHLEGSEQGPA